ncbi:MAG TPA: hypothetical protein VMU04_01355 [Candidatus Acidoferrum sp.]|nr:hypothetical protein [Candidatus Acidoferrum sp.]
MLTTLRIYDLRFTIYERKARTGDGSQMGTFPSSSVSLWLAVVPASFQLAESMPARRQPERLAGLKQAGGSLY